MKRAYKEQSSQCRENQKISKGNAGYEYLYAHLSWPRFGQFFFGDFENFRAAPALRNNTPVYLVNSSAFDTRSAFPIGRFEILIPIHLHHCRQSTAIASPSCFSVFSSN